MNRSGKPLIERFRSKEKAILDYVITRKETYYGSDTFRNLKNRCATLDDSIDMRYHPSQSRARTSNAWTSKIAMPLVREKYLSLRGMVLANFRTDPIISVLPIGDTGYTQAHLATAVLNQNLKRTKFRPITWRKLVESGSRYGAAVVISTFRTTKGGGYQKTMAGPLGLESGQMPTTMYHNVYNKDVDIRNYWQNPHIADPEESDYRGYMERVPLSQLIAEARQNEHYIKDNLREAIKEAKDGAAADSRFFDRGKPTEWNRVGIDVNRVYTTLPIEDNEEDDTIYYLEWINDKIIRICTNPNDENIVPIHVLRFSPRLDNWWSNSPVENSMPMENFLNCVLGTQADQALNQLQKLFLYDTSTELDMGKLQNALINNGFVAYNSKGRPASEIFYEYQPRQGAAHLIDPIIREIKEADQRLSYDNDFNRAPVAGGPQNETATAAIMMDEKGNVLKSDILEAWSYGLLDMGKSNLVLLQQHLPDQFQAQPPGIGPTMFDKEMLLGFYDYRTVSSLTQNKITRMNNMLNLITALVNFRGSMDPSFMNVNMPAIVREWIDQYDLPIDSDQLFVQPQPQMAGPTGLIQGGGPPPPPEAGIMGAGVAMPEVAYG